MSIQEKIIRNSIYHTSIRDHYVVLVPESGIFMAGQFKFQCLYGDIDVNGFKEIGAEYDPERFHYMAVHNMGNVPMQFKPYKAIKFDLELLKERVKAVMESVSDEITQNVRSYGDSIAVLLVNVNIDFNVSYLMDRLGDIFRPSDRYKKVRISREAYIVYEHLNNMKLWTPPEVTIDENQLRLLLGKVRENEARRETVFLAGAKGAGKSTICRFLLNKFVSLNRPLYLLDGDLGQAELTPMGCMSINKIDKPLFSLPFLHQPVYFRDECIFMGTLSPGSEPEVYRKLMHYLVHRIESLIEMNAILVVNSMGWIEKLGRELNLDFISSVRPTIILNFNGPVTFDLRDRRVPNSTHIYPYNAPSRPNLKASMDITAPQWRDFTMTGYLANCLVDPSLGKLEINRTLANVMARQVSFCRVGIYIHPERGRVAENMILNALNCAVVALCRLVYPGERNKLAVSKTKEDDSLPPILYPIPEDPPMLRCLGFGLIRSISPELKRYYLITPVPLEVCKDVDIFALGSKIHTPKYVFDQDDPDAPYLVRPRPGHQASKERTELIRKLYDGFSNITGLKASNRSRKQRQCSPGPSTKRARHS